MDILVNKDSMIACVKIRGTIVICEIEDIILFCWVKEENKRMTRD